MVFTESQLELLRCHSCKKFLSIGPILVQPNGASICGRCPSFTSETYRNHAYEAAVCNLLFPCSFEGCDKQIPWNNVAEHEQKCPHKSCNCLVKNCEWRGKLSELVGHFKEDHKKFLLKESESFELNFNQEHDSIMLKNSFGQYFVIKVQYKQSTLRVSCFYGPEMKEINVVGEVCLEDKDIDNICLKKTVKHLIPFEDIYSSALHYSTNSLTFDKIPFLFTKLKAKCKVSFKSSSKGTEDKTSDKTGNFLIKCCCPCDQKLEMNLTDDKYTEVIEFPCFHKGCCAKLNLRNVETHTINCNHRFFKCGWLNCSFKAKFRDLTDHVFKEHKRATSSSCKSLWVVEPHEFNEKNSVIINTDGTIFNISRSCVILDSGIVIMYEVSKVSLERNRQFRYEIKIFNFKNGCFDTMTNYRESEINDYSFICVGLSKDIYENDYRNSKYSLQYAINIEDISY